MFCTSSPRGRTCGQVCAKARQARMAREKYAADPPAARARINEWNKTDHGRQLKKAAAGRRRAAINAGPVEIFTHLEIFDRDNWVCGICWEPIARDLVYPHPRSASLDHVIPIIDGGPHIRSNVRASHLRCNQARGARQGIQPVTGDIPTGEVTPWQDEVSHRRTPTGELVTPPRTLSRCG